MALIHIFGLNHFHQNIQAMCETPAGKADEEEQKRALRAVLCEIITTYQVDFIADEAHPVDPSLGKALAQEHNINYTDIAMPVEERKKQGIHTPGYNYHPVTRADAYRKFEEYMFKRTKASDAKAALVMCGRYHLTGLEKMFKDAGDDTRAYDIQNYGWYRGVPIEGPDGIVGYDRCD